MLRSSAATLQGEADFPASQTTRKKRTKKKNALARPRKPRAKGRESAETAVDLPGDFHSRAYFSEISRYPLLTPDEEKTLAYRVREGDESARARMVLSNLRLVVFLAGKYTSPGVSKMDLIQEGNKGLMKAVEKFSPEKGFRFATYAVWWIRQAMVRAIFSHASGIRLPNHVNERLYSIRRTTTRLTELMGDAPGPEEISQESGMPLEVVQKTLKLKTEILSLDRSGEEQSGLHDVVEDRRLPGVEEKVEHDTLRHLIRQLLSNLDEREQRVLTLRFGLEDDKKRTLEQIGRILGFSKERIRQIEKKSLEKLKKLGSPRCLADFYRN